MPSVLVLVDGSENSTRAVETVLKQIKADSRLLSRIPIKTRSRRSGGTAAR